MTIRVDGSAVITWPNGSAEVVRLSATGNTPCETMVDYCSRLIEEIERVDLTVKRATRQVALCEMEVQLWDI